MNMVDRIRKFRFFRKNLTKDLTTQTIQEGGEARGCESGKSGRRGNRSGIALLTVLTVMALTTIMVVTFLSLATSEHEASSTYSNGIQAQQVAEEAVNIVIAQIRKATTASVDENGSVRATPLAWASQPGMIRTWDGAKFDKGYKLYSDDKMLVTQKGQLDEDFDDLVKGWSDKPEQFVDLNEPVIRGRKVYYPIVSPSASEIPDWPKPIGRDRNGVEGFRYNWDGKHSVTDVGVMGKKAAARVAAGHVAMPVRWIYQLADGTLGYLDNQNKFQATDGSGKPEEKNRIVARFAFWADDETSKLNINTAAGGLAWDIPRAGGQLDMDMAKFQPAQHEWQRYPGHPATTHLIPALAPGVLDIVNDRDAMEMLFRVVPRIVGGGSKSGTRIINNHDPKEENGLIADKDPLYPSVDDMIMKADRKPNEFPDAGGNPLPEDQLSEYLERAKFFITATSRAPETNLFNKPRVAIWPIYDAPYNKSPGSDYHQYLTVFDRLIHYCASMGGPMGSSKRSDYIFKRKNADSSTDDYDKIPRNRQLYQYLAKLMDSRIPGYGEKFSSKYPGDEYKQILTEIFDYIRCTNLHDDSLYPDFLDSYTANNTNKHLTYTNPMRQDNKAISHIGHGQVVPIKIGNTKGFGRFNTISSSSVVLKCCGAAEDVSPPFPPYPGSNSYRGRYNEAPAGEPIGTNYPPMPANINPADPMKTNWPDWLKQLYNNNGAEFAKVVNPDNWNWQLAFLDTAYRNNVLGNPSANKFNRNALTNSNGVSDPFSARMTHLLPGERLVQAALFFELFSPSIGWVELAPDMKVRVQTSGMDFGNSGGDPHWLSRDFLWRSNRRLITWGERTYGGGRSHLYTLGASVRTGANVSGERHSYARLSPIDRGFQGANSWDQYNLVTMPFKMTGPVASMSEGTVTFEISSGDGDPQRDSAPQGSGSGELVQTIELKFPSFKAPAPIVEGGVKGYIDELRHRYQPMGLLGALSLTNDPGNPINTIVGGGTIRPFGLFSRITEPSPSAIRPGDVVRSVSLRHGDVRIVAGRSSISDSDGLFQPHFKYSDESVRTAHSLTNAAGGRFPGYVRDEARLILPGFNYGGREPIQMDGAYSKDVQLYGDFDNGAGLMIDGPYINKPDEGNTNALGGKYDQKIRDQWESMKNYGEFPYFAREWRREAGGPAYFSPNRMVSGPGMFGSLSTGVLSNQPWRTLLFRPNVIGNGYSSHPGAGKKQGEKDPPDHVLMDLFWMPVVEPYSISEPLSTAGKINMNYALQPFKHIERTTALRGVLRSEFMMCVPNKWSRDYKTGVGRGRGYHWRDAPYGGQLQGKRLRAVIVEDDTLDQLRDEYFDKGDIFKSPSQICEIYLIGEDVADRVGVVSAKAKIGTYKPTLAQMKSGKYWRDHALIGDNSKERPYTNIEQRLTTKSNTFKVHYRAQVLKQARRSNGTDYRTWDPEQDTVQAEYRGSSIVERYVDSDDEDIPDYANNSNAPPLDLFYKFRVVNPTRFAP